MDKNKKTRKILVDSITSHQKAVTETMDKLAKLAKLEEPTYSIADRFRNGSEKYLLAYCGDGKVGFVSLGCGGLYGAFSVSVKNTKAITKTEFDRITHDCSEFFTRYWDNVRQVNL